MFKEILIYFLVAFIAYFVGTINFSKILGFAFKKKDITKLGSGNPGAMNMMRNFGIGIAFLTFLLEIVKAGATCLIAKIAVENAGIQGATFAFYLAGLFVMLGYCFPIFSKFKGGKGVACFSGIILFSPVWYIGLGWFILCFFIFLLIDYGSIISFIWTGGLALASTVYIALSPLSWQSIFAIIVIWLLYFLIIAQHRENIKRLINHTENKIGLKQKIKQIFHHKKGEQIIDESQIEQKPEQEIIIDDK